MGKMAKIAISLWVVTIGAFGYFFIKGSTQKSSDQRSAVLLNAQEKDMVLGEMRTILAALNGVLHGVESNDMQAASEAARSAGTKMAVDVNPAMMAKLPLEFKSLGMSLHSDFDVLADDLAKGLTPQEVIAKMALMTNKCVACHAAYRLSSVGRQGEIEFISETEVAGSPFFISKRFQTPLRPAF